MKIKFFVLLFLAMPIASQCQENLSASSAEGMWQVTSIDVPPYFAYDRITNIFTPYKILKDNISSDVIENLKNGLQKALPLMYVELKPGNKFFLNFTEKPLEGSYSIYTKSSVPSPATDEKQFLKYCSSFGYDSGIELYQEYRYSESIYLNALLTKSGLSLAINNLKFDLGGLKTACTYTLKKATKDEASAAKAGEEKLKQEEKDKLKAKAIEKEKEDELKDGKLYTSADKEPYFADEKARIQKVCISLASTVADQGLSGGTYNITAFYTVSKDGTIVDIEVPGEYDASLKKELTRQISRFPVMTPAEVGGQKVRFRAKKEFKFTVNLD